MLIKSLMLLYHIVSRIKKKNILLRYLSKFLTLFSKVGLTFFPPKSQTVKPGMFSRLTDA